MLAKKLPIDFKLILDLVPRIAFFFFFILDTLIVLSKIKFIEGFDLKWMQLKAGLCWTMANFAGVIKAVY